MPEKMHRYITIGCVSTLIKSIFWEVNSTAGAMTGSGGAFSTQPHHTAV